ncbi:hypothetical protein ASPZODRAFT_956907 [Penicilliopsis zonata CBS 506.65]|uniref:C2H2-type domain-containing protein n=1 Tax=Penicilliopsis zonata CBS 506.65 TaxID=1073090 RepID=A0A1L9S8J4_9EURO|nr:hypothetical protein ASPZODRAFT_956907 [Penicilliopsis zonata CBS 506.65]OJJ43480.1 hypothetical protein ASPZODRAFT_956907 [Penicilliopsis zonata CBS 506.65]
MNQDLMGINFSYSLINPSDQNFLSAHSPRPLPNLQSLPYLQPQNRLEDPGGAVAIGHLDSFIHCLENGNYPPSVLPRMAERLDRAYSTFQNLEKSHLPVAPGPRSLGESSKPGVSYLCLKCPQGKRKTIKSLGSFKRHVTTEHYYQYEYHCPRECPWFARRKDKVHDHLRSVHRERGSAGLKHMGRFEKQLPPPKHCPQCLRPVESWKDFFHCFASHCRVEEDGSPLSRRGDDDSGSGGGGNPNGQNDWNPGPSGINPGSYFPQGGSGNASFSANDTSYSGGGGGAYNNFHYASPSLQNVILSLNGEAPPSDQICPSAAKLKSDPPKGGQACPLSSPRTSVSALLQKSAAPPPSKAVSGTKNPLLGPLSAVHNASAGCEPSEPSKPPYTPNGLKHSKHRANLSDRKRKEKRPPKKSDAPRRQCLTCGHLFDGCARCQSVKLEGDWCHACLGRCGQRQVQPISYACHDPDSYLNFICNGVSERPSLTFAISVFTRLSFQPPWSVKDVCRALMSNTKLSTECKGAEQIPSWADVTSASTGINVLDFVANPNRFDQASRHDVPSIIHPMVTKSMALLLQSQPRKVDRPDRRVVPMPFELSRCFSPSAHFHQRKVGLYDYCRDLLSGDDSCNLSVMTIPLGFSEDVLPLRSLQFPSRCEY